MSQKTTHQALTEARALIADPAHWTQHAFARDGDGRAIWSQHPNATCFCALGALNRAIGRDIEAHPAYRRLSLSASAVFENGAPAYVNDQLGHEAVLKMYDHALEASKP